MLSTRTSESDAAVPYEEPGCPVAPCGLYIRSWRAVIQHHSSYKRVARTDTRFTLLPNLLQALYHLRT